MKKISKREAFSRYKNGLEFILVPSKMSPDSHFAMTLDAQAIAQIKNEYIMEFYHSKKNNPLEETFERLIANFYMYNCEQETGLRVSYWVS